MGLEPDATGITAACYKSPMAIAVPNWKRVQASVRSLPAATICSGISQVLESEPSLLPLVDASRPSIVEAIYRTLKESIANANADKRYYLEKLKAHNEIADALAEILAELVAASQQLAAAEQGAGKNDLPYHCPSSSSKSWMIGLPSRTIPIRVVFPR